MKFNRRVNAEPEELPITNLVDVLLLLIVFFMVSTVMSFDKGMGVKLPETESSGGKISNKGVSVLVAKDGKVFVNGEETPVADVGTKVKAKQADFGVNVILKSDKETTYQSIAEVMDRLIDVGISDLSLPVVEKGIGG